MYSYGGIMFFIMLVLVSLGMESRGAQQCVKSHAVVPAYIDDRSKIRSLLQLAGLGEHKAFIQGFKNAAITNINTSLDTNNNTLLIKMMYSMRAHYGNKEEIVKFLLSQPDIDLNIASDEGTALIAAIREGMHAFDLVEILVSAGANPCLLQKGIGRVNFQRGDTFNSISGDVYAFIKLYSEFPSERPKPKFYYEAIERGLGIYKKRKKIYTDTVHKEIAEQLHGVNDLANICMEYVVIPALPESVEKQDASSCPTTSLCVIS